MSNIIGIKFHSGYTANPVDKNHYTLKDSVTGTIKHKISYIIYGYGCWGDIIKHFKKKEPEAVISFIYRKPINKKDWL